MNIKSLILVFGLAFFVLLWIEFQLIPHVNTSLPAVWINNVLSNICITYITSFIFYYFVVYIKDVRDKKYINKYITIKIEEIILKNEGLIIYINNSVGGEIEYNNLNLEKVQLAFNNLNLLSKVPNNNLINNTFEEYFKIVCINVKILLQEIQVNAKFLDPKLLLLIDEIIKAQFIITCVESYPYATIVQQYRIINPELASSMENGILMASGHAPSYYNFLLLLKKLEKWKVNNKKWIYGNTNEKF